MKIAIQGQAGSFHDQAARKYFSNDITIVPCNSFREVFETLAHGHVEYAVVALENSLYGSLNETYDNLLKFKPAIIGEVYLHIEFNLYGIQGSTIEKVTDVYSHPAALGECREYLHSTLPWARQHEHNDTAGAVDFIIKENDKTKAAIASTTIADTHDVEVLDEYIDDNKHNYTRFAVLQMQPKTVLNANKTSVILHTDHTPGSLYRAMGVFAEKGINLTKLESRPIHGRVWHYVFYIDFECSDPNEREKLLEETKKLDPEMIVLGSYIEGEMPEK